MTGAVDAPAPTHAPFASAPIRGIWNPDRSPVTAVVVFPTLFVPSMCSVSIVVVAALTLAPADGIAWLQTGLRMENSSASAATSQAAVAR